MAENEYLIFLKFATTRLYIIFDDVSIPIDTSDSSVSYATDVSLNGGVDYLGAEMTQLAPYIEVDVQLSGIAASQVTDQRLAGFKDLTDRWLRKNMEEAGGLDVSVTAVAAADSMDVDDDERRMLNLNADGSWTTRALLSTGSSTTITFRLYSSPQVTLNVRAGA